MAVELREWEKNEMARRDALRERNRRVRMERLKDEIADGSARHGVYAIKDDIKNLEYLMGGGISGQRAFEMDRLRQEGNNAIGVEQARAHGLEFQGAEAARLKGAADVQTAQIGAESARSRWGYFDNDGTFHPGSDAVTAQKNFESALRQAEIKRNAGEDRQIMIGEQKLEQINRKNELDRRLQNLKEGRKDIRQEKTIEAQKDRRMTKDAQQEQRAFDKWKMDLNNDWDDKLLSAKEKDALKTMTPEEQKALWMKSTGRTQSATQQQNGVPQKGARKKFPNGETGEWDGLKWVPVS